MRSLAEPVWSRLSFLRKPESRPTDRDVRALATLLVALALASCGTKPRLGTNIPPPHHGPVSDTPVKVGKPYQVAGVWYYPADDAHYDEVGYASWYGDAFHGGPTANGEIYDMNMVGAAHKTLPLPCYVEVTALDTGRTVLVRVNDRGPFVANRIIDLSRRAAEQLGIARQGVARVRVRRVYPDDADRLALRSGKPARALQAETPAMLASLDGRFQRWRAAQVRPVVSASVVAPSADRPADGLLTASSIGGFFVQIGAYGDPVRADSLASQLGGSIDAADNVYRVRIGPYFDEGVAMAALARAQGQGYQDARLIRPSAAN